MMRLPPPSRAWLANAAALAVLAAMALALLPLHGDGWMVSTQARHGGIAAAVVAAYAGFCGWVAWRSRAIAPASSTGRDSTTLIVWASQTGFAQDIAMRTSQLLADAGVPHAQRPLHQLDADALSRAERVLFIASTTGEGDPPDHALAFAAQDMARHPDLSHVGYAVLALGDRAYAQYCDFGHRIQRWLHGCGARALFDLTEVDNGDPSGLRHWQNHVALWCGATATADWAPPRYQAWTLQARKLANPGSAGDDAFHLALQPPADTATTWQAGDIIEIGPRNPAAVVSALLATLALSGDSIVQADDGPLALGTLLARSRLPEAAALTGLPPQAVADALERFAHREYSIASLPAGGPLQLLVRRMRRDDGTLGIGSGWLCEHAPVGAAIDARVRRNPNFHAPDPAQPMLLIGNGTGVAGLRAHMAARIAAGARRNWLLLGERNAGRDDFFGDDLERWLRDGWLERLDRVYSRDGNPHRYVQDALSANRDALTSWVDGNAAIYVCGSLHGMAPAVDAVLRDTLGETRIDAMLADGLYRRDVY